VKIPHERFFILVTWGMFLENLKLIKEQHINCSVYFSSHGVLDKCKKADMQKMKGFFEENSLRSIIHGPFVDLNPGSLDEGVRKVTLKRLSQTLEFTKLAGSSHITFHSGFRPKPYRKYRDSWLEKSVSTWKEISFMAEKEGIMLTVENAFEKTPELLIELVEKVDSPNFSLCFDGGHYNAFSDTPPLEAFAMLPAKRIGEIHLSDNDGSDDTHVPLGEGNIDLDGLFKKIAALGIDPVFALEPNDIDGVFKSVDYLKKKGLIN